MEVVLHVYFQIWLVHVLVYIVVPAVNWFMCQILVCLWPVGWAAAAGNVLEYNLERAIGIKTVLVVSSPRQP